jgi:hypothetical protein
MRVSSKDLFVLFYREFRAGWLLNMLTKSTSTVTLGADTNRALCTVTHLFAPVLFFQQQSHEISRYLYK